MSELIASNRRTAILGTGVTGLSVARYLRSIGEPFVFVDTRLMPPNIKEVRETFPGVLTLLGPLEADVLCTVDTIVVSPGVALAEPALVAAREQGVRLVGDLGLFFDCARAPVVAITGSNGKSTVTTLVGQMAQDSGLNAGVGGNLGTPMLDLLDDARELYVLELSSFQLELNEDSCGAVATVLNVSADHMDRYPNLQAYHAAKHRIYRGARKIVVNRQDPLSRPLVSSEVTVLSFGLDKPDFSGFGVLQRDGVDWLAYEFDALMPVSELAIKGRHNTANALAALALGFAAGLPMASMLDTLRNFRGLPHRCETVVDVGGVLYIDDSKGTNVGATQAAINGFGDSHRHNIILIAGGQGKGQDFTPLRQPVSQFVKLLILIGEDADKISRQLQDCTEVLRFDSLEQAVAAAFGSSGPGDVVLLSPACASFDMFTGYAQRGDVFQKTVRDMAS